MKTPLGRDDRGSAPDSESPPRPDPRRAGSDFDRRAATWDLDPSRLQRAETVAEAIRSAVPLGPASSVFEYGCGTGLLGFALRPHAGTVFLADASEGMLEKLRGKIRDSGASGMIPLRLDLEAEPPPDGSHDLVAALLVLHHVADVDKVLRAFHRMLKPGGFVALADLDAEDGSFHGADFRGHKGFGREDMARRAESAGFVSVRFSTVLEIERETGAGRRGFPVFLMIGRKT